MTERESASVYSTGAAVTMYTTAWCGSCRLAKRFLEERGIPYTEIDIEGDLGAALQVEKWARGYRTVPTLVIGNDVIVDWRPREVEAALIRMEVFGRRD